MHLCSSLSLPVVFTVPNLNSFESCLSFVKHKRTQQSRDNNVDDFVNKMTSSGKKETKSIQFDGE